MRSISKKIRRICTFLALCLLMSISFILISCDREIEEALDITNYSKYINVSVSFRSESDNYYNPTRHSGYVIIKKYQQASDITLTNVAITYTFTAYNAVSDFEITITESLQDLESSYQKEIDCGFSTSVSGTHLSVKVLEISGKVSGIKKEADYGWLIVIPFAAILFVLIYLTIYFSRLYGKIGRIEKGMTISEVVAIMGEPAETNSVGDVTTIVWKRWVKWGYKIYCTVTFKNGQVISVIK